MNTVADYREMIRARIHAIISVDASDTLRIQALQERIDNRFRNAFQIEQANRSSTEESILQGTVFIKDHILSDITKETLTLFENLEPSIYVFMLTKAIYLFTLGSNNKDQIPGFFKPDTKKLIENQRKKFVSNQGKESITVKLQEIMKDFGAFEDAEGKDIKSVLACLKRIAYEEIHNGLFATKCLIDALSDSKYQNA